VNAGDLVIAGTDGVVIVPHESVDEILERAEVRMAKETLYVDAVKKGDFTNDWVAAALRADDCQID
jgi:regulator of RNase E activity RraA